MKLENEVYIADVRSDLKFTNQKRSCCFNCISYDGITDDELEILKKCHEKGKAKLTLEVEEPILDDVEKRYLSGVIRPFRDRVIYIIKKVSDEKSDYLWIIMKNEPNWCMPLFKKDTMYKGMEVNKAYKLEELGL